MVTLTLLVSLKIIKSLISLILLTKELYYLENLCLSLIVIQNFILYKILIVISKIDDSTFKKIRFNSGGILISEFTDTLLDNKSILRTSGNKSTIIKDNTPISYSISIPLKPIVNNVKSVKGHIPDLNVGSIDLETYMDSEGFARVYAMGFITKHETTPIMNYKDPYTLNSDEVVLNVINWLLTSKYKGTTLYCHNLKGFDGIFIIKILSSFNERQEDSNNLYNMKFITRDIDVIAFTISKANHSITIKDSYVMLDRSLRDLAVNFGVETLKGDFPHKFSKHNTLFCKGLKPSMDQYINISIEDYDLIPLNNWSFKESALNYLRDDINSHYQVLIKACRQVFNDHGVQFRDVNAISRLSLNIFFKDFYKTNIPNIDRHDVYDSIKKALYGGITEVYIPKGNNLYYYDVNYLYPFASMNDMPGLECSKLFYHEGVDYSEFIDKFGFFRCSIITSNHLYIGLLPFIDSSGVSWNHGAFEGWYFSEELKFAL